VDWLFIALIALSFGSFLNLIIYRIPKNKSIITPRSFCPNCNHKIAWYYNIPILSWIYLKGKCAYCNKPISKQYPLIEIISTFLVLIVYYKYGWSIQTIYISSVFLLILALATIDFYFKAVPDSINLLALSVAILFNQDIIQSLNDALIMMGVFAMLRFYTSYFFKKETLGEGDIILIGTIGAVLGVELSLFTIFLSSIIALPFAYFEKYDSNQEAQGVPYIPFLGISFMITQIFNYQIQLYIERLYG